jgi:hypothetical protein
MAGHKGTHTARLRVCLSSGEEEIWDQSESLGQQRQLVQLRILCPCLQDPAEPNHADPAMQYGATARYVQYSTSPVLYRTVLYHPGMATTTIFGAVIAMSPSHSSEVPEAQAMRFGVKISFHG